MRRRQHPQKSANSFMNILTRTQFLQAMKDPLQWNLSWLPSGEQIPKNLSATVVATSIGFWPPQCTRLLQETIGTYTGSTSLSIKRLVYKVLDWCRSPWLRGIFGLNPWFWSTHEEAQRPQTRTLVTTLDVFASKDDSISLITQRVELHTLPLYGIWSQNRDPVT